MKVYLEILFKFFGLGCISFGGPAAHIGYFQQTFVEKYKWLPEEQYARLIALSQFLPGPGSSQLCFAIGYVRGGLAGAICSFLGFTFPSFLLLYLVAIFNKTFMQQPWFEGMIHGLKILAVVVVADACLKMSHKFCHGVFEYTLAAGTAIGILLMPGIWVQMAFLVLAAVVGMTRNTETKDEVVDQSQKFKLFPMILFLALFLLTPIFSNNTFAKIFTEFYSTGSMVFGGGHVVLPILQQIVGDQMTSDQFLTGYASAQAVPGPMFTLASYLGAVLTPEQPFLGALTATLAIFVPGFLLLLSLQGAWQKLASKPAIAGAAAAINAAVVGLLVAALYDPVFESAVKNTVDMALVAAGFYFLRTLKVQIAYVVVGYALVGSILA